MASMYDEYERAVEGNRAHRARSPWGVVLGVVLGVFLLGGAAVVAAAIYAYRTAQNVVVDVMADVKEPEPATVIHLQSDRQAPVVVDLRSRSELRSLKHELRHELRHELSNVQRDKIRQAIREARATRTVHVTHINGEALRATEDALRETEYALQELEGKMSLSVDDKSLDLAISGSDDGAVFTLDVGGKTYTAWTESGDDGGRLHISTPEGESVFAAGEAAMDVPGWVPRYPGSSHPDRIFSGELEGKKGGAGVFRTDDSPLDVVGFYTKALEADGFEVSVQRLSLGHSDVQGSIVGTRESDGKTVTVVVAEDDGQSGVLTFWGQS